MPMLELAQDLMCKKTDQHLGVVLKYRQNCFRAKLDTTIILQLARCTCLAFSL